MEIGNFSGTFTPAEKKSFLQYQVVEVENVKLLVRSQWALITLTVFILKDYQYLAGQLACL